MRKSKLKNLIIVALISLFNLPLQAQTPRKDQPKSEKTFQSFAVNIEGLSALSYATSKNQFYSFGAEYFLNSQVSIELNLSYSKIKDGSGGGLKNTANYRFNSLGEPTSATNFYSVGARWYLAPQSESGFYVGVAVGQMDFTSSIDYDLEATNGQFSSSGTQTNSRSSTAYSAKGGYRLVLNKTVNLNISGIYLMPSEPLNHSLDFTINGVKTDLPSYDFAPNRTGILGELQILF